jgi:hypothetical protein
MSIRDLLDEIGRHFRRDSHELPDEVVDGFLRVLEEIRVKDMPCSQVFARLDEYVDKELSGKQADRLMPLLREHFDLCPDCCEEYETLLSVLQASSKSGEARAK